MCHFRLLAAVAIVAVATGLAQQAPAQDKFTPTAEPKLLVALPEICPTPDGLAMDAAGNIIIACPNYADQSHPAVLMKLDRDNKVRLFATVPVHRETGVACPMGIDFGPDGELYIADNQGWVKANDKGRVLRMEIRDGRPGRTTVVAEGLSHPNGVRVHKGHIYVTHSMLPTEEGKPLISGVYRFKLDDRNVKVDNDVDDENLLTTFKTLNMDCQYGADGLAFDAAGNLYVGNFGDATVHKITFDARGNVASNVRWAKDECMKSIDGIGFDKAGNLYVADFSANAICVVSPEGKVRVLAKSPDCDGSKGGLDQPGEPLARGKQLIVANFDMVTGPDKLNSGHDAPHTISVIQLEK
ncbi:MAG: SMP-30/gluconolactonase/LRE family protein [Candidatus Nealsonbacteria bacterium]|nr:SMP-30/gluconolactonase/LRE family protein [Candidatus Nealsonbacteria bacterium]